MNKYKNSILLAMDMTTLSARILRWNLCTFISTIYTLKLYSTSTIAATTSVAAYLYATWSIFRCCITPNIATPRIPYNKYEYNTMGESSPNWLKALQI